jgi:predicted PurR-regulated permease PerM
MRKPSPLIKTTQDRWFFITLIAATGAVGVLFSAYASALLVAAVVAIVTWPYFQRLNLRFPNKELAVALSAVSFLAVIVFGPLVIILGYASTQAIDLIAEVTKWLRSDGLSHEITQISTTITLWAQDFPYSPWDADTLPTEGALLDTLQEPLQALGFALLDMVTKMFPALVGGSASLLINSTIFVFALLTFYMEGPRIVKALHDLLPLDNEYERRLGDVFAIFAKNIVVGSLATALLQGLVAAIGYSIGGAPRVIFLALLTAVFSFIPFFGAAGVGVVVGIGIAATQSVQWGIFIILWSIVLTGTVDNVVKPMLLRGDEEIHPLLIFLAVFGGIHWMGITGALVGPILVALFLALFSIYRENYLEPPPISK